MAFERELKAARLPALHTPLEKLCLAMEQPRRGGLPIAQMGFPTHGCLSPTACPLPPHR